MAASMEDFGAVHYFSDFHATLSSYSKVLPHDKLNQIVCNLLAESSTPSGSRRLDEKFVADLEVVLYSSKQDKSSQCMACVTNCYRLCRNVCAACTENQTVFHNSARFIDLTHSLVYNCIQCEEQLSEDMIVFLRCTVQFLGNYCSGNEENQIQIFRKFGELFRTLLQLQDSKLREYVLMVVHITLTNIPSVLSKPLTDSEWQLLQTCVQIAAETDSHNGLLIVEDCWKIPGLCERLYNRMSVQSRILMLEVLMNTLKRLPEDDVPDADRPQTSDLPACSNVHYVAADFIMQSHLIPTLSSDTSNHLQVLCTVKELECLCVASACHKLYGSLQDNEQLIKTAVSLLQCIEDIGKQGNNVFTNVNKVSNVREVNTDHPVFGLKRDLIRLLGNMAYKHQHNQDLIRELDGILLILDQTNIDGKNPFITQWSVFAIHNLMEGNAENQRYLADLKLQGVANNLTVLDELGISAETEGQKVVIKKKRK